MPIFHVRPATGADAELLAHLGARWFEAAFGDQNTPEDMAVYLKANFALDQVSKELADPGTQFLVAILEDEVIGYAKLSAYPAPECVNGGRPLELARLYVEPKLTSRGHGSALLKTCLEIAAGQGYQTIWLGVWENNPGAIQFYTRWGFDIVGTQTFVLGRDVQLDFVMARTLANDLAPTPPG